MLVLGCASSTTSTPAPPSTPATPGSTPATPKTPPPTPKALRQRPKALRQRPKALRQLPKALRQPLPSGLQVRRRTRPTLRDSRLQVHRGRRTAGTSRTLTTRLRTTSPQAGFEL